MFALHVDFIKEKKLFRLKSKPLSLRKINLVNIALDAMGGDHAPGVNVEGAYLAAKSLDIQITLVGQKDTLQPYIQQYKDWPHHKIKIKHASETVDMAESPSLSFRRKKDSSIRVGLNLVKENICQGFVSSGNTGAVMTTSLFVLGRLAHVERPSLAAILPSKTSRYVMLDMGSNVDCKPSHLAEFAIMGSIFAEHILGRSNPKVGLLNIGKEKDKGNSLTQETAPLLESLPINYIGHIEGKDITKGASDVVVCDGFTGNNMLKFGEGIVSLFKSFFKEEAKSSLISAIGLLFLKPAFKRFKKNFDYDEYGGAFLLGVNGVSIVAHGSASSIAIKNAIKTAHTACTHRIVNEIEHHLTRIKDTQGI